MRTHTTVFLLLSAFVVGIGDAVGNAAAQPRPAAASDTSVVADVTLSVSPTKPVFDLGEAVEVSIRVSNASEEVRFLAVSVPRGHENIQKKTKLSMRGESIEVEGIPCYLNVHDDTGWDLRVCQAGYDDQYKGKDITLAPHGSALFRIAIPDFGDNRVRPTGKFFLFSRFAVGETRDDTKTVANGPETSLLIIDRKKLAVAVQMLKEALAGGEKERHVVEDVVRCIADNPLPEHAAIMVEALRHRWSFKPPIDWTLWYAAEKFVAPEIYAVAIAEAKKTDLGEVHAILVYNTIYRNRECLRRADAIAVAGNRRLLDNKFTDVNDNGFMPAVLLSLVATEADIPRLAELCGNFMPVRIAHDITHARYNRSLTLIRQAFTRYPASSRNELRKALRNGMSPGNFTPWAHEFSVGNVPTPLIVFGEWLAELRDTESIPILEYYAKTPLVRVSNTMQGHAPSLIARIDGVEAMRALRRLGPTGERERAKLGDPVAIDAILARARAIHGRAWDDTGEAHSLFSLVYSVLVPNKLATFKDIGDGTPVEALWKGRRQEFVNAFIKKYGFDPNKEANEERDGNK